MDYFNFDEAAQSIPGFELDDGCSSIIPQAFEGEAGRKFDSLLFDETAALRPETPQSAPMMLTLMNNVQVEVIPHQDEFGTSYAMFRAKEPCDLCRRKGMDCFLSQRGALITGCTCCISLFRECSFTNQEAPKRFTTFPGISEDNIVWEGSTERPINALKSFPPDERLHKTGARFPRESVKTLKAWLAAHLHHPYPTDREKDELKQLTGLKRSQIANWLANARRRNKSRPVLGLSSPVMGAIDIPCKLKDIECMDMSNMNPLDRWKASLPEYEPASVTAIARAVATAPYTARNASASSLNNSRGNSRKGSRTGSSRRTSSEDDSGFSMFRAPSVSSLGTHQSSTSDLSRVSKGSTRGSKGSLVSSLSDRRRRRRAPITQRVATQNAKSRSARIFQCTFCTDTFPAKYDWQRHEKSLHLALERWTCCPDGGTFVVPALGCRRCVFCQVENPTLEHLESHNFMLCQEKTLQERTFYRKDHLRQHLKLLHGTKFEQCMEGWKTTTTEIKSRCGFCPSVFSTWQQRADHLAAHFRNGSDMSQWAGGWGFEPSVERLVEDAMPPYLIAQERASMDPFVARGHTTSSSTGNTDLTFGMSAPASDEYQIAKDSNCWARLENELTIYIMQQKTAGVTPTDRDLQDRARKIIYDDEDPWNQTSADNKQWLDALKYQAGIGKQAPVERLEEVPIMPPYVVRGGLKDPYTRVSGASNSACDSGTFTPDLSALPFTPDVYMDDGMDIDLGQLDFNDVDLALFDNNAFVQANDFDTGLSSSFLQMQQFNSFETSTMSMQQKGVPAVEESLGMSDEDFNRLSGYMTELQ